MDLFDVQFISLSHFYTILLLYCYLLGFSLEGRREADERGCEDCTIKMMNGWLVLFEAAKAAERETRMRNEKKIVFFLSSQSYDKQRVSSLMTDFRGTLMLQMGSYVS